MPVAILSGSSCSSWQLANLKARALGGGGGGGGGGGVIHAMLTSFKLVS